MRAELDSNKATDLHLKTALKGDLLSLAISAGFTIPPRPPMIVKLDPTGAQNVTCPTKGSKFIFILVHGGTNAVNLTVKDSTGATIGTVGQGKTAWVIDDGVATVCGVMT